MVKRNITIASWMEEEISQLILDYPRACLSFSRVVRDCIEQAISQCAINYEEVSSLLEVKSNGK